MPQKRPRGRPKSFDQDAALAAAMRTFWEKGYEAASLDDLTAAMSINRPSLYAAFGNKRDLFLKSLEYYRVRNAQLHSAPLLKMSDFRTALSGYFEAVIESVTGRNLPSGCLIATVANEAANRDPEVKALVTKTFRDTRRMIERRVRQAIEDDELLPRTDAKALSGSIVALMQSIAAQARLGASRSVLRKLVGTHLELIFRD